MDIEKFREQLAHKQALLKRHKDYLQVAELQLSNHGITPPISLVIDIKECRSKISQLERDIVNLRNIRLKQSGEGVYPNAEHIITITDNDGEIDYQISCESLDVYISMLSSPISESLFKCILDYFRGGVMYINLSFRDDSISSNRNMFSKDLSGRDLGEIAHETKTYFEKFIDRNISGILGYLAFVRDNDRIGISLFDTGGVIHIHSPARESTISAYNTLVEFFKTLD